LTWFAMPHKPHNWIKSSLGGTFLAELSGAHQAYGLETVRFIPKSGSVVPRNDARYFAECHRPWPERWFDWERLRIAGRLPLFGISYTALILIPIVLYSLALYNDNIDLVRDWAEQVVTSPEHPLHRLAPLILQRLHSRPILILSLVLLVSTILLAIGSTRYTLRCPSRIKEFSRDQWCDQLGHSLLHYWPLAWRERYVRLACAACYALRGFGAACVSITAHKCPVIVGNSLQQISGNAAHADRRPWGPSGRWSPWFGASIGAQAPQRLGLASPPVLREVTGGFLRGWARLCPETAPGDDQGLGMMRQPIQACRGQQRIAKQVRLRCGRTVTGDEHAARFVPCIDHIVEIRGGGIDQGLQPEVVQHKPRRAQIPAQPFRPRAIRPPAMEVQQPLGGVAEEDIKARPACFMGECLRQMAFAHAGRPADQPVTFLAAGPHRWLGGAPAAGGWPGERAHRSPPTSWWYGGRPTAPRASADGGPPAWPAHQRGGAASASGSTDG
jgi:hypothetical protein